MHRNVLVIYHKDQDGLAAAFPFSVVNPKFIEFTHPLFEHDLQHNILLQATKTGVAYFLDCAPPPEIANRIANHTDVIILDHHGTTKEAYESCKNLLPNVKHYFRLDRCGAIMSDEFVAQNPKIFGAASRVDQDLLKIIDIADRNLMKTPEDNYRVSYLDHWLHTTDRKTIFRRIHAFNRMPDRTKKLFLDHMLIKGRSLYEENINIAARLFECKNHKYASLGLPGHDPRFYSFIPINPHDQGGREASRMACDLAEKEGVVFLYCKRDGVCNVSVRTSKQPINGEKLHAGRIAQFSASFGTLNSGGGGEQMGCFQLWPDEFVHLFKLHDFGKQVEGNRDAEACAIVRSDITPESVTRHFPPHKHTLAEFRHG